MNLENIKLYIRKLLFFCRKKIFLNNDEMHIILCGYPRSGTSLLYNMICSSLTGFKCEPFEKRFINRLHRAGNYITKSPMDIFDIKNIDRYNVFDKNVKVIICIRDIRDVLTSRHPNIPDQYFISFENSWWPQDKNFNDWKNNAPGIKDIFNEIVDLTNNDTDFLLVKYEDIILDIEGVQKSISNFLNVDFQNKFSDFYKHKDKHPYKYEGRQKAKDQTLVRENKAIDPSRLNKWKNIDYKNRIIQQFEAHPELFDYLVSYGYEEDMTWYDIYK